mgnify:CR=1 FL=1
MHCRVRRGVLNFPRQLQRLHPGRQRRVIRCLDGGDLRLRLGGSRCGGGGGGRRIRRQAGGHLLVGAGAGGQWYVGVGLVNSISDGFTVVVLSIFMVARGGGWVDAPIDLRGTAHAEKIKAALDRIATAVGNYVGGAIVQASIAGISSFILLSILGVPFAGALAVIVGVLDLIPLVGATIAAFGVALVTLFTDFPTATIVWIAFALAYQQFENYVVQPQIQKRAVQLEPIIVLVSVLFGGSLFGIVGALLAIPVAATIQISVQEWWRYRVAATREPQVDGPEDGAAPQILPDDAPPPAPA